MTARTKAGSRAKGKAFERLIARQLEQALPGARIYRQTQSGGAKEIADVAVESWLHLECKDRDSVSWRAALAQATRDAEGTGRVPIAVIRDGRLRVGRVTPVWALLRFEDWRDVRDSMICELGRCVNFAIPFSMAWRLPRCDESVVYSLSSGTLIAVQWSLLLDDVLAPLWRAGKVGGR